MFTFTELRVLCDASIFLKYSGYFVPLLLFIITKHVWKRLACVADKAPIRKKVIDISSAIQTDSVNDELDDELYKPHLPERDHVPYRGITESLDKSGEQFYKLANDRRSIRKYNKNKAVDFGTIEKCILAAGENICVKKLKICKRIPFFPVFNFNLNKDTDLIGSILMTLAMILLLTTECRLTVDRMTFLEL